MLMAVIEDNINQVSKRLDKLEKKLDRILEIIKNGANNDKTD